MNVAIGRDESVVGTFDHAVIEELLRTGTIRYDDLYWHEGMAEWKPVSSSWKSDVDIPPEEIFNSRRMGVILICVAAALTWLCVFDPISKARSGADSVSTSIKGVVIIPYAYVLGPLYLLFPRTAIRLIGLPQDKKKMMYVVSILLGLIGGLLYWLVIRELKAMGYS